MTEQIERRTLTMRFECRTSDNGAGLDIEGRAVPFGDVIDLGWHGSETFDADCVFDGLDNVKLTLDHDHVVGRATGFDQRDDGLYMTAHISDTTEGRDIAQLMRDGAIDSLSVGFIPNENHIDKSGVIHRRRVTLMEVAVTGIPAYKNATITNQRTKGKEPAMDPNQIMQRLEELEANTRSGLADLDKRIASNRPAMLGAQWRSAGEYLKALAAGDENAQQFQMQARDFIASTDVENVSVWVRDHIKLVESRRKVMNLFTHEALPATGMTVEFLTLDANSMSVTKQSSEGTALTYGELSFGSTSASVDTYGGYTSLSRQVIERSTSPALTTALRALTIAYAVATEAAARTYLASAITGAAANKVTTAAKPSAMTADNWIDAIIDAADTVDERGAQLGTLAVSPDVFKAIAKVNRDGNALMDVSGQGADVLGTMDLTGITGRLLRIPVQMIPDATADTAAFIDPDAVTVWESGGPFQLQQMNVTTLVNDYSVYGYLAMGTTFADGITPLGAAAD